MKDTTIWADPVLINLPTTPDDISQPQALPIPYLMKGITGSTGYA